MLRNVVRTLVVAGLVGTGWLAGQAQSKLGQPEFEIAVTVENSRGETLSRFTCVRGCEITRAPVVPAGGGPAEIAMHSATTACRGAHSAQEPCRIWGWSKP